MPTPTIAVVAAVAPEKRRRRQPTTTTPNRNPANPDGPTWASVGPTANRIRTREAVVSVVVLLLVRLPFWVVPSTSSSSASAAAFRGGPAAWPAPVDCGADAGAVGIGAYAVGVVEGGGSLPVLRRRRSNSSLARPVRPDRTDLRPVVRPRLCLRRLSLRWSVAVALMRVTCR